MQDYNQYVTAINKIFDYIAKMKAGWNSQDNMNYIDKVETFQTAVTGNAEAFKTPPTFSPETENSSDGAVEANIAVQQLEQTPQALESDTTVNISSEEPSPESEQTTPSINIPKLDSPEEEEKEEEEENDNLSSPITSFSNETIAATTSSSSDTGIVADIPNFSQQAVSIELGPSTEAELPKVPEAEVKEVE